MQAVAQDHLGDGAFEQPGADAVEQLEKPGRRRAEVVAAMGEALSSSCAPTARR